MSWYPNSGGLGGSPNGKKGGYVSNGSYKDGGLDVLGFALNFNQQSGTYGRAGKVNKGSRNYPSAIVGGSGGYNTGYVNVTPGKTYTLVVGAGGKSGLVSKTYSGDAYIEDNAHTGFVLIAYGGDI